MNLRAVVLNIRDQREHDRIITCYSHQLGKIEILVRSARKIPSKLAPLTSGLYALLNLVVEPGKNNHHLIGGEIKKYYRGIIGDYKKIILTKKMLKIIDETIKPGKANRVIFNLIFKTLEKIDKTDKKNAEIFVSAFIIKFLSLLGYRPEIKNCLDCRKLLKLEDVYFNLNRGGVVCLKCHSQGRGQGRIIKLSPAVFALLQDLLYKDLDFLEKRRVEDVDFAAVEETVHKFLKWQVT
jgi:DNA repair protein RecO (recombination protein O)